MVEPENRAAEIILSYAVRKKRGELVKYLGITENTFTARLRKPSTFKLGEIAALQWFLRIPDQVILEIIHSIS